MGICGPNKSTSLRERTIAFDIIPPDTQSLSNVKLPQLTFYMLISDIKIKKCTYDEVQLRFRIEGGTDYETPPRQFDRLQRAYWRVNHSFECKMTEYDLRKRFVTVEVLKRGKVVGQLRINLFTIWTGPYHLDFSLPLPESPATRISLNFKISQSIHLCITNTRTQLLPIENKFIEDRLTYSLQAIIGQQLEASNYAYAVRLKEGEEPSCKEDGLIETHNVGRDKIVWEENAAKELQLPSFDKTIAFYEMYASSLHLTFWKVLPPLQSEDLRYQLDSECFISLNKLLSPGYTLTKDPSNANSYFNREVQLIEKTWLHGKEVGKAKVNFKFKMQAHLKQMQACVRTQDGILTSSPVFSHDEGEKGCPQIEQLKKINREIQQLLIKLDRNGDHASISYRQGVLRVGNLLSKELLLLEKSSKQSLLFYSYRCEQELYAAQRFLIDLAFKVLTYIYEELPDLEEICWTILTTLMKRGEFKLSHLGFSNADQLNITNKAIDALLRMKIEVALKYQELLNHLLKEALNSLQFKGEEAERTFAESFCAYAYFRLPLFRDHILSGIRKEDDPVIQQWRGTQFDLYQDRSQSTEALTNDDFYGLLFDWQTRFYNCISGQERYKTTLGNLQDILRQDKWKIRLSKRSGAFFTFLANLVGEIQYVSVVSKHVKWQWLPGYSRLLHAFLVELKRLKLRNYTDRLRKCCVKLLANEKLLNVLVVLLLKKANLHEPQTTFIAFQMVDQFFNALRINQRPIPGTFDYKFFSEGVKVVLESDLEFTISQVLLLLYNHYTTFSQEFSLELSLFLLSKPFFRFFFHWSYNLRHLFHTLLFTRIHRPTLPSKTQSSLQTAYVTNLKTTIEHQFFTLLQNIQQDIEPNSTQINEDRFYQKTLFKKMRFKLNNRKGQGGKEGFLNLQQMFSMPDIRSTKSLGAGKPYITPAKLIYFSEKEMQLTPISASQMSYVRQAVTEYKTMTEEIAKEMEKDANYSPVMTVKKVVDEKELGPITVEEW